ncbi:hypothetical protein [Virgibacillus doumboii]|uniref:hypothetical protein n=1 Tax=Virgibacillus doumboii TaxID=2697503 RepID=UPI0013E05981|nr:hypothetical protein [Virgibacillus doumboii]
MIKNWTKKHTYILVGVIIAALIVYGISYFRIINPMKAEVDSLAKQVSMYETQYEKIIDQSKENIPDDTLSSIELRVPSTKSPDNLLINIQNIASSSNLTINHLKEVERQQEQEESSSKINETTYKLDATSSKLKDMNAFLEGIVESDRLMIIDTVHVQQDADQVFLTITFKIYFAE